MNWKEQQRQLTSREVRCFLGYFIFIGIVISMVVATASAQDYLQEIGRPTFTSLEPVELGFVNTGNGNLHLEVPLGSFPQRGGRALIYKLVYDSRLWMHSSGSQAWGINTWATALGGWRFSTSADAGTVGNSGWFQSCGTAQTSGPSNFFWTAPDGTMRFFPITLTTQNCGQVVSASGSASAQDSSGYYMSVACLVGFACTETVFAPDGTQVFPSFKDTNGNFYSQDANGNIIDTLGRTPVIVTRNCNGNSNQICYGILNSKGARSTITVTTASISVHTAFNRQFTTEFSGNQTVIQSVQLPDGTAYQFGYDTGTTSGHFGEITNATLPTGGQVSYAYSIFQDANTDTNHWISGHTSGGGTDSFSLGNTNTTAKTQQLTVTRPSGDYNLYTFTLNNGAWRNSVAKYSSSSSPLVTISNSWDTSNNCTSPCTGSGAVNVRKLNETVTTGTISRQTAYTYSTLANSLPSTVKEWNYFTGSAPTNPQRTTTIAYLSDNNSAYAPAGKNILNLPASIVVTDGSGTKLKETDYSYDSTTLTAAASFTNHDDTNFGTSNTTRGNRTGASQWVSGTTSLTTATLNYDTTGNVVKSIDAKNNVTTYSYTDCFANDNNANPPSSTSPAATNAYLTTTTLSLSGTLKGCYYYGSGKLAYAKDQNGATTYNHYQDADDRQTTQYRPIGWTLFNYTSSTELDTYLGIQDTTPATTCSSCRHDEMLSDNLARPFEQILASDPDGATTVKTDYDSNGRVLDTSHPYRSTSDPTYGLETISYDGLDRPIQVTHPDGTARKTYYGRNVSAAGGFQTQQCGSSCARGFPILTQDEAGKVRQVWTDAFGKVVEVDEPAANANDGNGSGTASGTITFSGGEQSTQFDPCQPNHSCPQTVWDGGDYIVTIGGVSETVTWSSSTTGPSALATELANEINNDSASPVSASASGAVVTFTTKFDYSVSVSLGGYNNTFFSSPSFTATASGAAMTGGAAPQLSSPSVTYYLYDPLERLTQVTVVGGTEANRTYAYDGMSRMTSATEPETGNGTSSHITSLFYTTSANAQCSGDPGSVCRRTDGRNTTCTYTYDALNRPTGMTYSDTTHAVTYSFDQTSFNGLTIANGLGRRTGMTDGSGTTAWSYDLNGNIVTEKRTIAGTTKTISYAYNGDNSLKSLTYPSGRVINFTVGNAERTTAAVDSSGTQYAIAPASGTAMYAPTGAPASAIYGKNATFTGLTESRSYNNRLELTGITASSSAATALNLAFVFTNSSHGNNGEILSTTNNVDTGRTQDFTYDDLSRLSTAKSQATSGADCWGQNFTFDAVANLTNVTLSQCSGTTLSTAVNGNNQFTSGFTYDAAGNMTNDGVHTYTYNGENEITTANGVTYTYDGNSMRVKKTGGTLYWRTTDGTTIAETDLSGNNVNEYVLFSGRRAARRDSGGNVFYYQADQVGSTRAITNSSGTVCYDADFTPFGQEIAHTNTCAQNYKFTGYERDSETGLDYAFNRYYNPRLGRFMSPDPLGIASANYSNPQSMNRYAYVLNNPLMNIDPRGLDCVYLNSVGTYDDLGGGDAGSTDTNSSFGECSDNGGLWFNGSVNPDNLDFDPDSNWVGLTDGNGNVQQASCQGNACSTDALRDMGAGYQQAFGGVADWMNQHYWYAFGPNDFQKIGDWFKSLFSCSSAQAYKDSGAVVAASGTVAAGIGGAATIPAGGTGAIPGGGVAALGSAEWLFGKGVAAVGGCK